ncbi:FecCD family ABC transporter permease [Desulforhopalus singaporensis]|uniref:Iron complex transport system permease protein n=1 Tax=Desulforhopalus singaporensis TaxID=91360 RepID=A0A1H0NXH3_9BACT|nr:iron ABC transporter permease [Desulforhopalus singaporensis]SDO97329.1 iron complex transport system permease protein [Desulforhopalus singaporensis]
MTPKVQFHGKDTRFLLITVMLVILTLAAIIVSAGMGYIAIGQSDILRVIGARLFSSNSLVANLDPSIPYVVMDVRLPRILTAALVGAGLALSGVIYQGILLNPLADPYTLGISSGAAFGASLALLANISMLGFFSTPLFAFTGAVATLLLVMRLSTFNGQISAQTLILSGVIVGAILSAGISFMKYIADEQVAVIIFWLMGSFASATWGGVVLVLLTVFAGLGVTLFFARDLNIMSLGRRSSDSLGVDTARVRRMLLLSASFVAAVCVAVTGIIGFIGLIVPHLMRYIVGPDNRKLIPASALAGAVLLLTADTITRAVLPVEVPIGVLTALIGGPFFCVIFRQKQKGKFYE